MENETYKIVKIIDDYRVVINAGKREGIKPGMELEIFIKGVEIKDDVTGDAYGTLDYVKGVIGVTDVMEGVSICENVETYTQTVAPYMAQLAATIEALKVFSSETKTLIRPLGVEQTQITGYGFEIDKVIRLGDLVRARN